MVKLTSQQALFQRSLGPSTHLIAAAPSQTPTPHPLDHDWSNVATPAVVQAHGEQALPLLRIDLAAAGLGIDARIPVLYHELVFIDCVAMQLDADGRIQALAFLGTEGPIDLAEELDGEEAFEEGVEEAASYLADCASRFLALQRGAACPEVGFPSEDSEAFSDWAWKALPPELEDAEVFGPFPSPVQSFLAIPCHPQTGAPLPFVGRISSAAFGMADITHFVFYDPDRRVVAQVMQMS